MLRDTAQMEAASGSFIEVLTIARAAGLVVLVTEALFLWSRRREPVAATQQQAPLVSRFFWAATPAALLAGLALWCLSSVAPARTAGTQGLALQQQAEPAD